MADYFWRNHRRRRNVLVNAAAQKKGGVSSLRWSADQLAAFKASMAATQKPTRKKPEQVESGIQIAFIAWVRIAKKVDKRLCLLFSVPNGGKRGYKTAATMKAEGQLPGVCDILLPVKTAQYGGLAIEFKRPGGGVVSDEQKEFMELLAGQGWRVTIHTSTEAAIAEVQNYLK